MRGHDSIGRLAVTWQVDAAPDGDGRARLDALPSSLVDQGLPEGLLPGTHPDELVCVRRVALAHRMRWDRGDAELVDGWGQVVAHAVSAAVARGGPGVVTYRSVAHARRDLVAGLLRGDRDRLWAWRGARVWPETGPGAAADAAAVLVLRSVLEAAVRDEPHAGVGLVVELARAGLLPAFVAAVPPSALDLLAGAAWRGTTGGAWPPTSSIPPIPQILMNSMNSPTSTTRSATAPDGPGAGPREVSGPAATTRSASTAGSPAAPPWWAMARSVAARSAVVRALAGVAVPLPGGPAGAATALAALAVLDVDPGLAAGRDAGGLVAALAALLGAAPRPAPTVGLAAPAAAARPAATDGPAVAPDLPDGPHAEPGAAATSPTGPGSVDPTAPTATRTVPATQPAAPDGRTRWGGLLFLLPLVAGSGLPEAVAAHPDRFGPALRPVLHELGRRLLRRAAAAEPAPTDGPVAPTDPAVLAFAGLAPDAEPPTPPLHPDAVEGVVDDVVARLHQRLAPWPHGGPALLGAVCRRRAVIVADPGWIDVALELDEVDVDVRRAGLDLDPGYLPWLGAVVRFRYG